MPRCHYCEREENLQMQIGGFWFCFWCLPRALKKGAAHWVGLAFAMEERR